MYVAQTPMFQTYFTETLPHTRSNGCNCMNNESRVTLYDCGLYFCQMKGYVSSNARSEKGMQRTTATKLYNSKQFHNSQKPQTRKHSPTKDYSPHLSSLVKKRCITFACTNSIFVSTLKDGNVYK